MTSKERSFSMGSIKGDRSCGLCYLFHLTEPMTSKEERLFSSLIYAL